MRLFRKNLVLGLSFAVVVTALVFAADLLWVRDRVDRPFVVDEGLIGTWQVVDFVEAVEDFSPDKGTSKPVDQMQYSFKQMAFTSTGASLVSFNDGPLIYNAEMRYTKGHLMHLKNETDSHYVVKEFPQGKYLFFEWKSGDYSFMQKKPLYYVLKQVDALNYVNQMPKAVRSPEEAISDVKIDLSAVEFTGTGEVILTNLDQEVSAGNYKWTKGAIWDQIYSVTED